MDEPKTLQELAREKFRFIGEPLAETEVSQALIAAGIDPRDHKERERYRRLVVETAEFQTSEEFARLRPYVGRAEDDLIDSGATEQEILGRAWSYRQVDEWIEEQHDEQRREFYREQTED